MSVARTLSQACVTSRAVLALVVGLLAGCGEDGPRLAPLAPDAVILAFGDSLTRGTGAPRGQGYPEALAELTGRVVHNAGVQGELSAAGAARLEAVLDRVRPQLLILCHGGNDMLRKRDLGAARGNLERMVAAARARGIETLLIGVPRPGLLLSTAPFYEEAARAAGVALEDEALADILGDNALKADPVHPNADGYRELAGRVRDKLVDLGAL